MFPRETIRRGDTTCLHLPQLGSQRHLTHVTCLPTPVMVTLNSTLYPDFIRRRFGPPRHQVVTEEIDRELLLTEDKGPIGRALVDALVKKQSNEDDKDDVSSRLNELATFVLVGFGFSTCKVGTGT